MAGPLLFVKADDFETFGVGPGAITDAGGEVRVWEAIAGHEPPHLDGIGGVVMFGSSYNVEHADEQPFIHEMRTMTLEAIDRGVPYLGICFGAQVLAWSLGAGIDKAPVREVGYVPVRPLAGAADDPLLSVYGDGDMVFQWHMDTFELPQGATLLAAGDDVANQAYRVGENAWATQWHFEIDRPEIELWTGEVADTVEAEWGKSPAQLFAEADVHQRRHEEQGAETFRRFAKVAAERA
jgi:GMP synthase-like glutamine amidotransferase